MLERSRAGPCDGRTGHRTPGAARQQIKRMEVKQNGDR
jgi:hypothetical protein